MRVKSSPFTASLLGMLFLFVVTAKAVSVGELMAAQKMTPQKFASYFSDFSFQFHAEVQDPKVFLETKSGDCDDYATLAATVLANHGYTTRLIAIRMPQVVHVVCYIEETHSYLDYNERGFFHKTVSSGRNVADIAAKVASGFGCTWRSASEFTYGDGMKRMVATVLRGQPAMAAAKNSSQPLMAMNRSTVGF